MRCVNISTWYLQWENFPDLNSPSTRHLSTFVRNRKTSFKGLSFLVGCRTWLVQRIYLSEDFSGSGQGSLVLNFPPQISPLRFIHLSQQCCQEELIEVTSNSIVGHCDFNFQSDYSNFFQLSLAALVGSHLVRNDDSSFVLLMAFSSIEAPAVLFWRL